MLLKSAMILLISFMMVSVIVRINFVMNFTKTSLRLIF